MLPLSRPLATDQNRSGVVSEGNARSEPTVPSMHSVESNVPNTGASRVVYQPRGADQVASAGGSSLVSPAPGAGLSSLKTADFVAGPRIGESGLILSIAQERFEAAQRIATGDAGGAGGARCGFTSAGTALTGVGVPLTSNFSTLTGAPQQVA